MTLAKHAPIALLTAALLLPSPAANAAKRGVSVRNDFFSPKTVRIGAGGTVVWTWRSAGRRHDVASPAFGDSGYRRRGTFRVTFGDPGRYRYFCSLHPGMTGTVVIVRRQ